MQGQGTDAKSAERQPIPGEECGLGTPLTATITTHQVAGDGGRGEGTSMRHYKELFVIWTVRGFIHVCNSKMLQESFLSRALPSSCHSILSNRITIHNSMQRHGANKCKGGNTEFID